MVCDHSPGPRASWDLICQATVPPVPSCTSSGSRHSMGPSEPLRNGPGCPQGTPRLCQDYGLCFSFFHTALEGPLSEDTLRQAPLPQGLAMQSRQVASSVTVPRCHHCPKEGITFQNLGGGAESHPQLTPPLQGTSNRGPGTLSKGHRLKA